MVRSALSHNGGPEHFISVISVISVISAISSPHPPLSSACSMYADDVRCIDDVITFFRYRAKVKLQDLVLFATLTDGIYASGVGHLVRACIARDTFR